MNKTNPYFNFYIQSSIHVALSVVFLALIQLGSLRGKVPWTDMALLFTASISGYNFVKYAGIARLHHRSLTENLKLIQLFSLVSGLGLLVLLFEQSLPQLFLLSILALINFLYAIPFLPKNKNLRSLRGVKIFIIALIWALAVVVYPRLGFPGFSLNWELIGSSIQIFCFVIALTLPFEIHDLKEDQAELGTFPQLLGIKKTKLIGYGLSLVFAGFAIFLHGLQLGIIPELLITLLLIFVIYRAKPENSFYFSAFWVEGIPIVWFGFEQLFQHIA